MNMDDAKRGTGYIVKSKANPVATTSIQDELIPSQKNSPLFLFAKSLLVRANGMDVDI